MKILMFGRGVITTTYGWAFAKAGHEVTYLVRPGKVGRLGGKVMLDMIDARQPAGKQEKSMDMNVTCVESLADLDDYDITIVSVQHDQMQAAAEQLAAAPRSRLGTLFFNNCWDDPASVTAPLGGSAVLWGFPVAGGGFTDERHLCAAIMPNIHLAEAEQGNAQLHAQVKALFESAGLKVEVHNDFRAWLWLHFAVNAGMVSQALIQKESSAQLVSSSRELAQAARLAREAVRVVYARGVSPSAHRSETAIATMPPILAGLIIKNLAGKNPATRRLMTVHTDERSLARFPLDVLEEAQRLQVPCPRLQAADAPAKALLKQAQ
jgi:2-dehydropantoate 2-reductase